MLEKGIEFEPSAPYSQEQNGISERKSRTLMERVRTTIIGGNIPDNLWPEVLLAITHISNLLLTSSLNDLSPYEESTRLSPELNHLRVLGSTVYVYVHEEERKDKSAKWESRAKRGVLVGYDGHSIYRVYLKKDAKVIQIKDLQIFKDASGKSKTSLLTYDAIIYAETPSLPTQQRENHTLPKSSNSELTPHTQTRSG